MVSLVMVSLVMVRAAKAAVKVKVKTRKTNPMKTKTKKTVRVRVAARTVRTPRIKRGRARPQRIVKERVSRRSLNPIPNLGALRSSSRG